VPDISHSDPSTLRKKDKASLLRKPVLHVDCGIRQFGPQLLHRKHEPRSLARTEERRPSSRDTCNTASQRRIRNQLGSQIISSYFDFASWIRSITPRNSLLNHSLMKISWVTALIASGVGATVIADMFLKRGAPLNSRSVAIGAALYALVAIPVALAYREISFNALFIIWEGLTILVGLAIGILWFHEPMTTRTVIAALFAIAAMALMYTQ
jgi:multidrug transporter EmrE-like cation transporter